MNLHQVILVTIFQIGFSVMAFYVTKKGNYSGFRLKLLGFMGIIIGVLAVNAELLVIAPRVPYQLKDGIFGGAGGIMLGSFMFNALFGGILLGLVWNKSNKPNTDSVINQSPIPDGKNRYPGWLNNFAHSTVVWIGGISIGRLLISVYKHQDFSDAFYIIGATSAVFSGIYFTVVAGYSIYKWKSFATSK